MDVPEAELDFACPRCRQATTGRFYGPCAHCSAELGTAYPGLAREVEAPEYEPKMNVTPNAVASKDS